MSSRCANCDRLVPPDARVCPYCAQPLNLSAATTKAAHGSADDAFDPLSEPGFVTVIPAATAAAPPDVSPITVDSPGHTPINTIALDEEPPSSFSSHRSTKVRFAPGAMLGRRYRIVALIGRGGMGEVYRADDLELDQPVALKLLPREMSADPQSLARLRGEVRVARQVSHPSVCRVYDLAEADGIYFLAMEYVDGEDLATTLRRMGRSTSAKANEWSRQLCAGLAAVHESGALHRDLKPANVMIDGRGRVRLTDFGLASFHEDLAQADPRDGTPLYASPEQLAGQPINVRSDIYSLGLILYELYTGKRAFSGQTVADLKRRRAHADPISAGLAAEGVDPAADRVIARCLDRDPVNRPVSALAVAAALPGGDPIAAALAAGETPSPELIAATPREALRPAHALALLALIAVALAAAVMLSDNYSLLRNIPQPKPPAVLREIASEYNKRFGYEDTPAADAWGYDINEPYLSWIAESDSSRNRWERTREDRPPTVSFWHRTSPASLVPENSLSGSVSPSDPPMLVPGMTLIDLDGQGHLTQYLRIPLDHEADGVASSPNAASTRLSAAIGAAGQFFPLLTLVPKPQRVAPDTMAEAEQKLQSAIQHLQPTAAENQAAAAALDTEAWDPAFVAAQLDRSGFVHDQPQWVPPCFADARAAWIEKSPTAPKAPIRIEAAAYKGHLTAFRLIEPFTLSADQARKERKREIEINTPLLALWITLLFSALIGSSFLARYNLRSGRGDRRGAFRVALAFFAIEFAHWILSNAHPGGLDEVDIFSRALALITVNTMLLWLMYLALEPFVRRVWPEVLAGWARLISGQWLDPLVGREILAGTAAALALNVAWGAAFMAYPFLGASQRWPGASAIEVLARPMSAVGALLDGSRLIDCVAILFFLVLLRLLLRSRLPAAIAGTLILGAAFVMAGSQDLHGAALALRVFLALIEATVWVGILLRVGLLANLALCIVWGWLTTLPLSTDLSTWYAPLSVMTMGAIVVVVLYAFYSSLGGQKIFSPRLLET